MNAIIQAGRPAEILLVEDYDNDAELTILGFQRVKLATHMHRVCDGEECMSFLRKQDGFENAPTPDLILLDLNMPRMDGREVLAELAKDAQLRCLPVVILTTSSAEQDILAAYDLKCSSYIVKPVDFQQFVRVIQSISDYWFTVVVLPSVPKPES